MPKVSVVMPAYNAEAFISQAIESVLTQNLQDWELVIVDDGSNDATPQIIERYIDPRLVILRQTNQGEASARNAALAHATGKYIAFLDADDLYLPNALEELGDYLDEHAAIDVVISDGWYCDGECTRLMKLSEHRPGPCTGNILESLVLSASVIAATICTMARNETIKEHRVRFDPKLVIGPDWDFWIQLARFAQFGCLDSFTCLYRIHGSNITQTAGRNRRTSDLLYGRLKILHSDWFHALSLPTRRAFLHQLLVGLMTGDPDGQLRVTQSLGFLELPPQDRGNLFRIMATTYLLRDQESEFAAYCLNSAVAINSDDLKSRTLLRSSSASRLGTKLLLRAWQLGLHALPKMPLKHQRSGKPVPIWRL